MAVPAVAACFLSTPYWEVSFVTGFNYNPYISIRQTFALMFGDAWKYLWPVIVISILQILGASLVMSAIDRHFRTGSLSFKSPFRLINYSVFALLVSILTISIISIILRFILFGLVILVQAILIAAGVGRTVALVIISIIAVAMFVVHVLIITHILYWAPVMFIYGYRFRDAAAASFKLTSGKKLFTGIFLPLLLCAGIQLIVGFLQVPMWATRITNFVLFLFTNVYVTVYVILSFYQISGLDRRDVTYYEFPIPPTVTATATVKKERQDRAPAAEESSPEAGNKPAKKPARKKSSQKTGSTENGVEKKPNSKKNKQSKPTGEEGGDVV